MSLPQLAAALMPPLAVVAELTPLAWPDEGDGDGEEEGDGDADSMIRADTADWLNDGDFPVEGLGAAGLPVAGPVAGAAGDDWGARSVKPGPRISTSVPVPTLGVGRRVAPGTWASSVRAAGSSAGDPYSMTAGG